MRQIILDTETTGLDPLQGHRIIEIGCVEIIDRRLTGLHYHQYLQPDRDIDAGALEVHGITAEFLRDKPRFVDIVDEFLEFVQDADLIIHNAPFDLGFLNHELGLPGCNRGRLDGRCNIIDTLMLARNLHPGQKNSLDALCKRYDIDNSQRSLHGALLDAEILADVYLAMTGGQSRLMLETDREESSIRRIAARKPSTSRPPLLVLRPSDDELVLHERHLDMIDRHSDGRCVWRLIGSAQPVNRPGQEAQVDLDSPESDGSLRDIYL